MADTPDFEQIARTLLRDDRDFSTPAYIRGEIAEQLRLMWNARGAADIAKIEHELATIDE